MLLKKDEAFDEEDQKMADLNHDQLIMEGINGCLHDHGDGNMTMKEMALTFIHEMQEMVQFLFPNDEKYLHILGGEKQKFFILI